MLVLLSIGGPIALYLLIAFYTYKSMMPQNANAMQKSMGGFVALMALAWPLVLAVKVLKQVKRKDRP